MGGPCSTAQVAGLKLPLGTDSHIISLKIKNKTKQQLEKSELSRSTVITRIASGGCDQCQFYRVCGEANKSDAR